MTTPIHHSITINRPINDVFTFVTDFRNDTKWWKSVHHTDKITDGDIRVGTEFIQHAHVLFVKIQNHLVVTEWETPRLVRYRNNSQQLAYDLRYQFESIDNATRFSLNATLEMKGLLALLKPVTMIVLKRQLKSYFNLLKQVLETS